jgi:hypothetical protein
MSIKCGDKEYGDDHKLYGYQALEDLSSFQVLIPDIIKQWEVPATFNNDDIYCVYFCCSGSTYDLVLDDVIFSVFAKRYCDDIRKAFGANGDSIIKYMQELINMPGNKVLSWS